MDVMKQLAEGLEKLTGVELIECDQLERQRGNVTPVISTSGAYQLRIAAIALNTDPHELQRLPARKLQRILIEVNHFLLANLDEEEIVLPKSEE